MATGNVLVEDFHVEADAFLGGKGVHVAADGVDLARNVLRGAVGLPLNTMCSMKCEMPFEWGSSSREPVFTQTPMETERICCICSVMTVSPLGSTSRRICRVS